MTKSNKEAWSGFNLGRPLFTTPGIEEYDRWMARKLARLLRGKQVIADYGSGDGAWCEYLAANYPAKRFIAVEWNMTTYGYMVAVRKPGLMNLETIQADMTLDEGVVPCDFFLCFGGLEHSSDHAEVLKRWVSKLTPGGECIITVPNLLSREWLKNRCGIDTKDVAGLDRVVINSYGYEELWSPNYLVKFVMEAGLEMREFGLIETLNSDLYIIGSKRVDKNV